MAEAIVIVLVMLLYLAGFFIKKSKLKVVYSFITDFAVFIMLLLKGVKPEPAIIFLIFSFVVSGFFAFELPSGETGPALIKILPAAAASFIVFALYLICVHKENLDGSSALDAEGPFLQFFIFFTVFSIAGFFILRNTGGKENDR